MTAPQIVEELRALGRESYKSVLLNHCIKEPVFGVSIEEMKKIVKREKMNYQLALDLYDTGIYDAMYLAGLIADDKRMTQADLQRWVDHSSAAMTCEYTVPWVAAGSNHGREMALKWIDSDNESIAAAGWSTYSSLVAINPDSELDLDEIKGLLERVRTTIHLAPNRARLTMNGFVISVGCYIAPLTDLAVETAKEIGKVSVDMGRTACKVPYAPDYIDKVRNRGSIGKKRKSAKC